MYTEEQIQSTLRAIEKCLRHETADVKMSRGFKQVSNPVSKTLDWEPNNSMTIVVSVHGGSHDTDENDQPIPEDKHPLPAIKPGEKDENFGLPTSGYVNQD